MPRTQVIHDTALQDAPRPQFVQVPPSLTAKPHLPPLPAPALRDSGKCRTGCYSNEQVRSILDAVLNVVGKCWDQLDQIRGLSTKAVSTNPKKEPPR